MRRVAIVGGVGALALLAWSGTRVASARHPVDFNAEVRPILNKNCVSCHGGVRQQANLSLLFREDAMKPAKSGKRALVPGDVDESELVHRITASDPHDRMPKEKAPLSDEDIATLTRWVAQGAKWEPHWAYVKPVAAEPPAVRDTKWVRNPIDRFVLARLDAEGLTPQRDAECAALARRVSLDLIGLPPTPERADEVCKGGDAAYAAFVDSLLASPRYGERWAAVWLDLARYADSKGYESDGLREMWRYRDWVIKAFNDDLPFDRFTIEQLAGDLLPDATESQRIATGFHRNTMTNREGGTDDEEFRMAAVIDRVNTTWTVWQGTTIACAQCHGHPYDPIRHEEYYQALAFFNNTADRDLDEDTPVIFSFTDEKAAKGRAMVDRLARITAEAESLVSTPEMVAARRQWEGELEKPEVAGKIPQHWAAEVLRVVKIPEAERDGNQSWFMRATHAELSDDPRLVALKKERWKINGDLAKLGAVSALVMEELPPDSRRTTHVLERGNFMVKGAAVSPGVPAAVPPALPAQANDRLALAKWLVSRENPLTARVTVNRFWEQLFGIGLVESTEDFGTQGTPPSNQALLDWLAVQLVEADGWRVKSMLKRIVLSSTYRQGQTAPPALVERDPQNRLLARGPRFRLTAEQIRDQALFVSGLLSEKMYGPSVMPPQPDGIWFRPYAGSKWVTAEGPDRYRRALYTFWRRTAPYPSMLTFDSPSREFCVSRRVRTDTPLQALVTMNDPAFVEMAQALGRRMLGTSVALADSASIDAALVRGYRLALQRAPDAATLGALRTLYREAVARYSTQRVASRGAPSPAESALGVVANAVLNLDAFVTN